MINNMKMIVTTYSEFAAENGEWFSSTNPLIKIKMKTGEKFPKLSDKYANWNTILTL